MRQLIITILSFVVMLLCLCACGSAGAPVDNAVAAVEVGDNAAAQRICDDLLADSVAFNDLDAVALCRVARVLMTVADSDANIAAAVKCLNRARSLDDAAVDAFIDSIPADIATILHTLDRVGTYLNIPRENLVVEDAPNDSINSDSII